MAKAPRLTVLKRADVCAECNEQQADVLNEDDLEQASGAHHSLTTHHSLSSLSHHSLSHHSLHVPHSAVSGERTRASESFGVAVLVPDPPSFPDYDR